MTAPLTCPSCHAPTGASGKFCGQCGAVLVAVAPPAPVQKRALTDQLGDRRVVTVLFADVSGFTALSEHLAPEHVTSLINDFFGVLSEVLYRYGGVVDKYIGDAIMAVFGAPVAHENDPERAARAALEMQREAVQYSERLERDQGITLRLRVGLHTGLVVAGQMGTDHKRDYTVLGDTVNVAQGMEAHSRIGGVLVSEDTYRLLEQDFHLEPRGDVPVKGRSLPIKTYELLSTGRSRTAGVELVGRDRPLAQLEAALDHLGAGNPLVMHIRGEAGVGKTGLLNSWVQRMGNRAVFKVAQCRHSDFAAPLELPAAVARSLFDLPESRLERDQVEAVLDRAGLSDDARQVFQSLLLGVESPLLSGLSPEHRQGTIFRLMNAALMQRAEVKPFVLVLENLQWCDDGSARWIQSLASEALKASRPFMLVLAYRPGERILPVPRTAANVREIGLELLSEADARALILKRFEQAGQDRPVDFLLQQLVKRGGGNPRFLTALCETLMDYAAGALLLSRTLPMSIVGFLTAKLDTLPVSEEAKQALDLVAVLAEEATSDRLMVLMASPTASDSLAALQQHQVLGSHGERWSFQNPLMQEVCYERILLKRRRELHAQVAETLKADQSPPSTVAEHYVRADLPAPAALHLTLAAERSLSYFSNQEALLLVAKAREMLERAGDALPADEHLQVRLFGVESAASAAVGDVDTAIAASERLVELAENDADRALAYDRQGDLFLRKGHYQETIDICGKGLSFVHDPVSAARLKIRRANALMMRGDLQAALNEVDGLLAHQELLENRLKGFMYGTQGLAQMRLGQGEMARTHLLRSLEAYSAAGDAYGMTHAYNNLGSLFERLGDRAEASAYYTEGLRLAQRVGDRRAQSMLINNLGMIHCLQGDNERAREAFRHAVSVHRDIQDRHGEAIALCNLGEVSLGMGDEKEAETHLFQSLLILEEINSKSILGEVYRLLATLKLQQGKPEEVLRLAQRANQLGEETAQSELQAQASRLLVGAYQLQGATEAAIAAATETIRLFEGLKAPADLELAYEQLSSLLSEIGRHPQALTVLDAGLERLEAMAAPEQHGRLVAHRERLRGAARS